MKTLLGRGVVLTPTEGGYQTEKRGIIVHETPKRISVKMTGRLGTYTFSKDTCKGVSRMDRTFPNYQVTAININRESV